MFNFAYSVSRTSRASSRARSSIFTEEGDIEMDFFSRQVKKIEASMKTTDEKKAELIKEMEKEKQEYKALKSRVNKLRTLVENRQAEYDEKLAEIKAFDMTEEQVKEEQRKALEEKEKADNNIVTANKSLQAKYAQINEVVGTIKSIPKPKSEYPPLYARTEALRKTISNRQDVIQEGERKKNEIERKVHELELREMDLKGQLLNLDDKMDFYDLRKKRSLDSLSNPDDQSLDSLEKLVDHLEQVANQSEIRFSTLGKDEVDPDVRRKLVELDRIDSLNSKRRHILQSKHEALQREIKEIQRAIRVRQGLSRDSSDIVLVKSKKSPEEVEEILVTRTGDLKEKYCLLADEIKKIDQLELQYYLERDRIEKDWKRKMRRIEAIQDQSLSDDQTLIKINQLNEEIATEKHAIDANASKIEMLQRRAQLAVEEREKNLQLNPEIIHSRMRVEEKQAKVANKQADLNKRKMQLENGSNVADSREIDLADLLKRTNEIEALVKAKGVEIEAAKEKMQNEQTLLDQALAKIPLDKKIKILENL